MKEDPPLLASSAEFEGRVALVTGGTDGIGRHLSQALVSLGCDVFFCGRRETLGRELEDEWGSRAHYVRCDLADPEQTRAFVHQAGALRGSIDFLVNNAAIDPVVPFEQSSLEQFDFLLAVNLRSYFLTTQTALPYLREGRGKAVVNIGSTNWMIGNRDYAMYAASKSGILGLTRSLTRDLGPEGIRVNMLSLGWIMTARQLRDKVDDETKAKLREATAMGYVLDERHVTPSILFLLSNAAVGIAGQNIVVDGGLYLH